MTAVLKWKNSVGATATWSTVTKLRFKSADNNTDDSNDPLVKPTTGTNYSYEKYCQIHVTTAPGTSLSNLKLLSSVNFGGTGAYKGLSLWYGFVTTYAAPVQTHLVATNTLGTTEISWSNAGTLGTATTGAWGDTAVFQVGIGNTASGGEITDWNITARYDEI